MSNNEQKYLAAIAERLERSTLLRVEITVTNEKSHVAYLLRGYDRASDVKHPIPIVRLHGVILTRAAEQFEAAAAKALANRLYRVEAAS